MIEKKKPVRKTTKKETDDIKPTLITDGDNSDEEVIEKPVKNETNSSIAKNVLAKKKKTKTQMNMYVYLNKHHIIIH